MVRRPTIARAELLSALIALTFGSGGHVQVAVAQLAEPFVSQPVVPAVMDLDLRTLPVAPPWRPGDPIFEAPGQVEIPLPEIGSPEGASGADGEEGIAAPTPEIGITPAASHAEFSAAVLNFDGIPATGVVPPDTVGDVGPDHYIQAVNIRFAIFDKTGTMLVGPTNINCLWRGTLDCSLPPPDGVNDLCESNNNGDPDVKYDPLADRWLISQFTRPAPGNQCIAISRTPDPVAGGWYLYDFPTGVNNDYPKFGVWPDAYYMGTNAGYPSGHAFAFDRSNMLNGNPATFVRFSVAGAFMLPSDLDGAAAPPAGAPNVFLRFVEGAEFGGLDRLELREFHVDFGTPVLSTFTALADVPTVPFDSDLCGFGFRPQCITQPGTAQLLDTLRGEPMYRLQYRNLGSHEMLVVNHAVDVDGADRSGLRWYELRKEGGVWGIFQEGTYSPDGTHRWMGSISMDKTQNIALGYSVSSTTVFPGIRYAGRLASDPLGTMPQGEFLLIDGGGSQSFSRRWGDYSAMSVDPVDDCTFWYTTEYYQTSTNWRTRIGAFRFPTCPIPVANDIKPGSFPNAVNPRSKGVIPVAILTTPTFDATTVEPLSVQFGPNGATEAHGLGHIEDVDGDGDLDLVLHFRTQDSGIQCGDTSASWTGETQGGQAIEGADSITTVGCT
jgi:hypothetical protein